MINSFPRLIDGMIEALRLQILPHTEGEFARGQIFGVIFMLKTLKLRANWSPDFLASQLDALDALQADLGAMGGLPGDAPALPSAPRPGSVDDMVKARDAGDAAVSALVAWLDARAADLDPVIAAASYGAIDAYIHRQLKHEIMTSAKPMFAEMSSGREDEMEGPR